MNKWCTVDICFQPFNGAYEVDQLIRYTKQDKLDFSVQIHLRSKHLGGIFHKRRAVSDFRQIVLYGSIHQPDGGTAEIVPSILLFQ